MSMAWDGGFKAPGGATLTGPSADIASYVSGAPLAQQVASSPAPDFAATLDQTRAQARAEKDAQQASNQADQQQQKTALGHWRNANAITRALFRANDRLGQLPMPGGIGALVLGIFFLLIFIVIIPGEGETRANLLWDVVTGGKVITHNAYGTARPAPATALPPGVQQVIPGIGAGPMASTVPTRPPMSGPPMAIHMPVPGDLEVPWYPSAGGY